MNVTTTILVLATLTAAAVDVKSRRIPNALTGALALVGVGMHVPHGLSPTLLATASMLTAFVVGAFAFSAGWFGGGDVKLIAACCGLVGFPGSVTLVLEILVCGALLALVVAAVQGRFLTLVRSTAAIAAHGAPAERTTVPYGVAIAAGSLTYALSSLVPALRLL